MAPPLPFISLRFLLPRAVSTPPSSSFFIHTRTSPLLRRLLPQSHTHIRPLSTTVPLSMTLMQVLRNPRGKARARHAVSPALRNRPQIKGVCLHVGITKPKKPNSGERKTARVKLSSGKSITAYIPGEGMFGFCFLTKGRKLIEGLIGHNVQQHSVVLVRGGRSQDCPGVRYHLVRGAMDLVSFFIAFFSLSSGILLLFFAFFKSEKVIYNFHSPSPRSSRNRILAVRNSSNPPPSFQKGGVGHRVTSRSKYGTKKPKKSSS